jgi:hypothetical protein
MRFDFGLVIIETPNKWRPVERRSGSDRHSWYWYDLYIFSWPPSRMVKEYSHGVQVNWTLLSNGHYQRCWPAAAFVASSHNGSDSFLRIILVAMIACCDIVTNAVVLRDVLEVLVWRWSTLDISINLHPSTKLYEGASRRQCFWIWPTG